MIVGDDVCLDVVLTSSLPPVITVSLPWLKRLPGRGFMILSSIWPIRGVQRKPLSASAVFSRDPSWKWSLHQGSSILREAYSATLQPPLAHILQTASHAEIQKVLSVSGLPPASLSREACGGLRAVRGSGPHVVALVVRGWGQGEKHL